MSRKVASFGQLIGYIDRDAGQEVHRIRRNVWGRDPEHIRAEFERNGNLLSRRKNGVYLYHEIISITRAKGLTPEQQKDRLQSIAETYIAARCPDNMVFGGLHQDKDHSYHYHLMISSNRAGETGRLRLSKAQFREAQVGLERHVLETYPELEQKVAIEKRSERGRKKGEAELERRTGNRPKREEVLERVLSAYGASQDRQSLLDALGREGLELYARGKTLGVVDLESGKNHRLKTLDLETADQVAIRMEGGELSVEEHEPEAQEPERDEAKAATQEKSVSEGENKKTDDRSAEERSAAQREKRARTKDKEATREKAEKRQGTERDQNRRDQQQETKTGQNDGPIPPGKDRREFIDKGHLTPDPERDLMSHEEWREQDTFFGKMKQSLRRTYDDFQGRTKDPEEKAQGKEPSANPPPREKTPRETGQSAQQEKWRSEMSRSRETGRDDPEQGRE
jgi:hypothetical protein